MRTLWVRLGQVPSLVAVLAWYAALAASALLLDDAAYIAASVLEFAALIAYCAARPHHRSDVFCYAGAPGPVGGILDAFGISAGWGLLVLLVTLPLLRDIDRRPAMPGEARGSAPAPASPGTGDGRAGTAR